MDVTEGLLDPLSRPGITSIKHDSNPKVVGQAIENIWSSGTLHPYHSHARHIHSSYYPGNDVLDAQKFQDKNDLRANPKFQKT